jgi:hypothetical protein
VFPNNDNNIRTLAIQETVGDADIVVVFVVVDLTLRIMVGDGIFFVFVWYYYRYSYYHINIDNNSNMSSVLNVIERFCVASLLDGSLNISAKRSKQKFKREKFGFAISQKSQFL